MALKEYLPFEHKIRFEVTLSDEDPDYLFLTVALDPETRRLLRKATKSDCKTDYQRDGLLRVRYRIRNFIDVNLSSYKVLLFDAALIDKGRVRFFFEDTVDLEMGISELKKDLEKVVQIFHRWDGIETEVSVAGEQPEVEYGYLR